MQGRFATRVNLRRNNKNTMLKECAIGWKGKRAGRCAYSKLHRPQRCPHKQGTKVFQRSTLVESARRWSPLAGGRMCDNNRFRPGVFCQLSRQQPTFEVPMKVQVQPAAEDDAADACNVIRNSILECCDDDHRGDAKVLEAWLCNKTPNFVHGLIRAPNAFSVVATVDGKTVGFGSASATGEITLCYVAPSVRFRGVGKALLAAIEDHAARAGVETLRLESTRTARTFYLRNGFASEGPPVLSFGIEGQPMRKQLWSRG
ncbi:GNAT family N-acetyltransferase [Variovorax sp. RTB1]|uniref:GNAT family N-acetyltransferase n=1 Tax=Variovorax sp. RTB1 TaxID=3048631 RepID=UPI002B223913|nr:GNAT family N-acetyltransferase [Variovorax sp. RTB1]